MSSRLVTRVPVRGALREAPLPPWRRAGGSGRGVGRPPRVHRVFLRGSRSPSSSSSTTAISLLDARAWSALASSLSGRLVLPSSPNYATARLLYDPRFDDMNPAAVAYCASPADVQRCVSFARAHGIGPVPRCGGHSYGGYSSGPGLVVDVTAMNTVTVSSAAGSTAPGSSSAQAVVGAGTLLVDLYNQLAPAGVLVPGGSCPTVGIAGLALGGGVGVVARKYGLTCDAIESVQIVTADARVLRCDAGTNEDLYWACRGGGGGNFGVVTSFTFRAAPLPDLALFTLDWPWSAAAEVLGAWFDWQHAGPDELWSNCQLLSTGQGGLQARVAGMLVGSATSLGSLVDILVEAVGSAPTYRFVGPEQYLHAMLVEAGCESLDVAQCHLTAQNPAGTLDRAGSVASSAYVSVLPRAGHRRLRGRRRRPRPDPSRARRRARLRRLRRGHQCREGERHRLRPSPCGVRHPGERGHGLERLGGEPGPGVAGASRPARWRPTSTVPAIRTTSTPPWPIGSAPTTGTISIDWCR